MSTLWLNLILLIASYQQGNDLLRVDLVENDSGWYYIVPRDSLNGTMPEQIVTNADGVCYISTHCYRDVRSILVYRNGLEVTSSIQFLSKISHDAVIAGSRKTYRLIKFYFPANADSECCIEAKKNDPDTYTKYSKLERIHRNQLIAAGKIRFE